MQAIAEENFYPSSQYERDAKGNILKDEDKKPVLKANAKGYKIKPLSALHYCEAMTDGFEARNGAFVMNFTGVKLLLRYGLSDPLKIEELSATEMREVAQAIYTKSALAEAERKN